MRRCRSIQFYVACSVLCSLAHTMCKASLSEHEKALISIVAEANRANRGLLDSFDMSYSMDIHTIEGTMESVIPRDVKKTGRLAFEGRKLYSLDNLGEQGTSFHFVQADSKCYLRTQMKDAHGLVVLGPEGTPDIAPGTPDPWSMVDEGVSGQLDTMDEKKYGRIVSANPVEEDGKKYIRVEIARTENIFGMMASSAVTLWYSQDDGYLPVRVDAKWVGEHEGHQERRLLSRVKRIAKYDIGGNTLYVPTEVQDEKYEGENKVYTHAYKVMEDDVKVNPDLPEELFSMPIFPDDQVIDKATGIELQSPLGHGLLIGQMLDQTVLAERADEMDQKNRKTPQRGDALALRLGSGDDKIELVYIGEGDFLMGSPWSEVGYPGHLLESRVKKKESTSPDNEHPQHLVSIPKGYYMGKYEVTSRQYRHFRPGFSRLPHDQKKIDGPAQPALVSFRDAMEFCTWLSQRSGMRVRLPSEAEWEYACRAGTQTRFYWGNGEEDAGTYANIGDRTYEKEFPGQIYYVKTDDGESGLDIVGRRKPNGFGLFDMIGNAPEWCQDRWFADAYQPRQRGGEAVSRSSHSDRVVRGGGWMSGIMDCRSASRKGTREDDANVFIGFRVVVEEAESAGSRSR